MKKIIFPIIGAALFIVAVGILMQKTSFLSSTPTPQPTETKPTVTIDSKVISVEIAKTNEEREKGLSDVASLEANSGMLFVFDDGGKIPTFWMKGMIMPIDILWISDGKIIRIDKNVPAPTPNTPDSKLKTYSAGRPVNYVLEMTAGFSDSNSIKVGDSVSFSN